MTDPHQDKGVAEAQSFFPKFVRVRAHPNAFKKFQSAYRSLTERIPDLQGVRVLDAGCGVGCLEPALRPKNVYYVGLDACLDSLRAGQKRGVAGISVMADMGWIPFRDSSFHVAVGMASLEFCHDKSGVLREIRRILRENGKCYFEVRNGDFPLWHLPKILIRLLRGLGILAPLPAGELRDLGYDEWRKLLESEKFRILNSYDSVWPSDYGGFLTRVKNKMISGLRAVLPREKHYSVGFLCEVMR